MRLLRRCLSLPVRLLPLLCLLSLLPCVLANSPAPSGPAVPCPGLSHSSCLGSSAASACAWCQIVANDTAAAGALSQCLPYDACALQLGESYTDACRAGLIVPALDNVCRDPPRISQLNFDLHQAFVAVCLIAIIVVLLPWAFIAAAHSIRISLHCLPAGGCCTALAARCAWITWLCFGVELSINRYLLSYHWCLTTLLLFGIGVNTAYHSDQSNEYLLVIFATGFILMEFRHLGLQLITTIKGFIRDRYRQGAASGVSRSESSGLTVRTMSGYLIIIMLMVLIPPLVSLLLVIGFDESDTFRSVFTDEEERQIKLVAVLDVLVSFASSLAREGLALTNERKTKHHETEEHHHAGVKSKQHHADARHADAGGHSNGHPNGHSSDAAAAAVPDSDPEHVRVHIPDDERSSSSDSSSRARFDSSGDEEHEEKHGGGDLPPSGARRPQQQHQSANMELADLKQSWVGSAHHSGAGDSDDAADGMQYVHVSPALVPGSAGLSSLSLGLALGEGDAWVLPRSFKHPWATLARMLCPRKIRRWMLESAADEAGSNSDSASAAPPGCCSYVFRFIRHAWRHYYLSRLIDITFLVILCIVANAAVHAHHENIYIRADQVQDADGILVLSPRQTLADSPLLQKYWAEQEYDNLANVIATLSLMRTVYVTTFLHPMTDKNH